MDIDYPRSKRIALQAVRNSSVSGDYRIYSMALSQLGILYWINGQYDSAYLVNKKALGLRLENSDTSGIATNYHNIGLIFYYKSEYDSALQNHIKALELWKSLGDTIQMMKLYSHIGLIHEMTGRYPEAFEYLLKSSRLKITLKGYNLSIYNISGLSNEYYETYYNNEIRIQQKSLIEEEQKDPVDPIKLSKAHHSLGLNYFYLGKYDSALIELKASHRIKIKYGILPWWNDLARAYLRSGMLDSALYCHYQGLETYKARGTAINVLATYEMIGRTLLELNDPDRALPAIINARDINEEMGNRQALASSYHDLGNVFFLMGQYKAALESTEKSLEIAEEVGAVKTIRKALKLLVDISEKDGDYNDALIYLKRYNDLNETIVNGENLIRLAQMELQYENEIQKNDLVSLEQKDQLNQARIQRNRLIVLLLAGVLGLSILLIFSVYRRSRLKHRANLILEKSNKEKEVLLSEIHHRVKNNLQIVSSLLSIQSLQLKDQTAVNAVKESQNRVQAMGLIHESLYRHKDFKAINMQEYLEHLCVTLMSSFGYNRSTLSLIVSAKGISLDLDTAIPLGLITNELLTNSLKHAFIEQEFPILKINMIETEEGLCLQVEDNGTGKIDFMKENSFGIELVQELAKRLDGSIRYESENGVKICVVIKKYQLAA